MIETNMNNVRIFKNRYALAEDNKGQIRVLSLLRDVPRELQGRIDIMGDWVYTFAETIGGYKRTFNQSQLRALFDSYGHKPNTVLGQTLLRSPELRFEHRVSPLLPGDLKGLPRLSTQLDPHCGGWVIATVTPEGLLFGSKPKVHDNEPEANAELERLASISPGTEFVLLKATKTAVTQTVQTKEFV